MAEVPAWIKGAPIAQTAEIFYDDPIDYKRFYYIVAGN
jgi:hypothetical protein